MCPRLDHHPNTCGCSTHMSDSPRSTLSGLVYCDGANSPASGGPPDDLVIDAMHITYKTFHPAWRRRTRSDLGLPPSPDCVRPCVVGASPSLAIARAFAFRGKTAAAIPSRFGGGRRHGQMGCSRGARLHR